MSQVPHILTMDDLDPEQLRASFGSFPSGVTALCAYVDGQPVGLVATSFTVGVSFEPPLVLFSIQHSSRTWLRLGAAPRMGVSVLGVGQAEACMQLASRTRDRFEGLEIVRTGSDSILLGGAAMWMECERHSEFTAGDHDVVVLAVTGVAVAEDTAPLIYHQSGLHPLQAAIGKRSRP
ncbi:MAG: flavin reductase [Comamonadaceae bacterium]|nr:MAG: flavin reductase [Comamonadaceae bacterium]